MRTLVTFLIFLCFAHCKQESAPSQNNIFYQGVDISFLPLIEKENTVYLENGQSKDFLKILHSKGVNLIRLRLWHTPIPEQHSLSEVLDLAKRLKNEGLDLLLDIHYSDTWADPANQTLPLAWQNLSQTVLEDSVYQYTKKVMQALKSQNTLPALVQIGNEINSGMLWDKGRVGGDFDANWSNLTNLLKKGLLAVKEIDVNIQTMIHLAGTDSAVWFLDNLKNKQVNFDILGVSFYPWWHGKDFNALQNTLNDLANNYDKPILIAETAYPFTLNWNDWTNNVIGENAQLMSGFPASAEGQKQFLIALKQIIKNIPNQKGIGFCYWGAEWVAFRGNQSTNGSSWENLALFDFDFNALPALDVFGE